MTLAELPFAVEARIAALPSNVASYLRAIGVGEGTRVVVVRAAVFGGPLFVRASSGAEVAIDRELARAIELEGA